jgi:thiol peroxidase
MASITLEEIQYILQENYQKGTQLADFKLIQNDLSVASLSDFAGKRLV